MSTTAAETVLTNALLVLPGEVVLGTVALRGGLIAEVQSGRSGLPSAEDLGGDHLIPGVVDVHTDNLERQVQPRANARWPSRSAMLAHDAQCAASGVTTVLDALCLGDLGFEEGRIRTFRDGVADLDAMASTGLLKAEHFLHLRCELPAEGMFELLDPVADRLYIFTTVLGLAYREIIPWWLVAVLVGRDVLLSLLLPYSAYKAGESPFVTFFGAIGVEGADELAQIAAMLDAMGMGETHIPRFDALNRVLQAATGWTLIGVEGLLPELDFFDHLANRRFPVTWWIRRPDQIDYIEEPDLFHDLFGHVPLLMNPVFADYMEAYGRGGVKAHGIGADALQNLTRLYWYTVEFGLMQDTDGLRIYGAGIVSSATESVFALEDPSPNRLGFDLERVMRTLYRIDDFQQVYFVIDSLEALKDETLKDFGPIYERLKGQDDLAIETVLPSDRVFTRGTQAYAAKGGRFAA